MNVTEQDVRDLIKKYQRIGVQAIATQVPISTRNLQIIAAMSKFIGPVKKRWRGTNWQPGHCLRENAERVSVYPKNWVKASHWLKGTTKPVVPQPVDNPMVVAQNEIARLKKIAEENLLHILAAQSWLLKHSVNVHGVVLIPEYIHNSICSELVKATAK